MLSALLKKAKQIIVTNVSKLIWTISITPGKG